MIHLSSLQIAKVKEERQLELVTRDRLQRMKKDRQEFISSLKDKRKKHYKVRQSLIYHEILKFGRPKTINRCYPNNALKDGRMAPRTAAMDTFC